MKVVRNIRLAFTGGAIGAFIDGFNIWFMFKIGISDLIGIEKCLTTGNCWSNLSSE